jgi:uroporphyrinogen-III synthase
MSSKPDTIFTRHYDSEALWQCLLQQSLLPRRVLVLRATEGRDWLIARLQEKGVHVCVHALYQRLPTRWNTTVRAQVLAWAAQGVYPVWLLASGASVAAIKVNIVALGLAAWWQACRFMLIHPRLVPPLIQFGVAYSHVKVCVSTDDAIFNALATG